jgi:signal transduction histidine kinase
VNDASAVSDVRRWLPDAALGLAVTLLGLFEINDTSVYTDFDALALFFAALGTGIAVGLSRHLPGLALALVWVTCAVQVASGLPILLVQLSIAVVAFGTARWGSTATLTASALSIPAAAVLAALLVLRESYLYGSGGGNLSELVRAAYNVSDSWQVGAVVIGVAVLGAPWLAGLALRFMARARASEVSQVAAEQEAARAVHESEQAREIARLREEQTRLARDVHDVVGHSLAVILAQAESAQYLDDVDTQKLKVTMENIATSARSSLQDVRQVLTPAAATEAPRSAALEDLIAGVRASGHEVVSSEVGTPQPLPPELEVVAFRVLQEMLTNAIKHGQRDEPVFVERHWPDGSWVGELRIEVRNVARTGVEDAPPGQGLDGMHRRLEAVGGRLDVRRREAATGPTFTVTAWVPVRTVSR